MTEWLHHDAGYNLVRVFALAYTAAFAIQQGRFTLDQQRYIESARPMKLPVQILWWAPFAITPKQAVLAGRVLIASVVLALAANIAQFDILCRVLYGVAFVSLALVYPHIANLGYVIRKILFAPVVFLVLACAPGLTSDIDGSYEPWPFLLLQGYIALVYWSTGLEKVIASGRLWWQGEVLRGYLLSHHLWGEMPLGLWVASRPRLCQMLSIPTLIWETVFPVALFIHPWGTMAFVAYGISFHVGTATMMRIDYHKYWFMNYLVFIPQAAYLWSTM